MATIDGFRKRLADREVILIDGGFGPELQRLGVPRDPGAWLGPAVLEYYGIVRGLHECYVRAGADVLIANTMMANHYSLEAGGLGDRVAEVNRRSIEAAIEARENTADRPILIAGSLSPAFFGAKTVTVPDATTDPAEFTSRVHEQATVMAEAGADLFVFEMIPTAHWGHLALNAIADLGLPVWLAPAYGEVGPHSTIAHPIDPPGAVGELLSQVLAPPVTADVMAVTLMHTDLADMDRTLDEIEQHWDGVLGAYPHSPDYHPGSGSYIATSGGASVQDFAAAARGWVERGVQIIGGCCGTAPVHIRVLKEELPSHIPATARKPVLA